MYSQGSQKLIQYLKMVCKVLKTLHFSLSCGIIGTNGDSAPTSSWLILSRGMKRRTDSKGKGLKKTERIVPT